MTLTRLSRAEFLESYWDYRPGQHVAFIEPTGGGKTRLEYQLLREVMAQQPQLSVRVTIPKRRDSEAQSWNAALGLKEIPTWPPPRKRPWEDQPPGYALWPRHLLGEAGDDPDTVLLADRAHVSRQMKACAMDSYQGGDAIHVADDIYDQAVIHGMNDFFTEMLVNGRSMGCGLWGANQKPSGTRDGSVTSFFYNSPTHLFLGKDTDERNRDRFGEIGGVDRKYVSEVVERLQMHQFGDNAISDKLYICKSAAGPEGPAMAIIGP